MTTASMWADIQEAIFYQKLAQADGVSDALDTTYVQEDHMNAVIEREMELAGVAVNDDLPDAGDAVKKPLDFIGINYPQGERANARFIAATPENLIQAGRALADLADGQTTIITRFLIKPRLGVLIETPSESGFSRNSVFNRGMSGSFSCFEVKKMGRYNEYTHPRFASLMRKNLAAGYDPRLTISKHVIAALILLGLEPVFVDVSGQLLDADNCWQLIATGMEWQYEWLNR